MLNSVILKNFTLSVDGEGYAGRIEELTLPKLTIKTEEFRGGGMDMPIEIDMGMEKMECDFTLTEYSGEVIRRFGLAPGNDVPLTLRGAAEAEDGTVFPITVEVRGIWKEVDMGTWKAGEKAIMKVMVACRYYKYTEDGTDLIEVDLENMKRIVNGEDQLEAMRGALGF
jgi:uncharacterized protein